MAMLLGAAFLAVQPAHATEQKPRATATAKKAPAAKKEAPAKASATAPAAKPAGKQSGKTATAKKEPEDKTPGPLADFGGVEASKDVVHVANWLSHGRRHKKKAFVLVDKKQAKLYVFDASAKLKGETTILLGKAIGDHSPPGIGNKPFSQIKEDEKTTPAGWFYAQTGKNTKGEDIIWVDYKNSVSMHRTRMVDEEERRAERMATPDPGDNRISYGCINVPAKFYDTVLKPTVRKPGAYVLVLPETKTPQQLFGSSDVTAQKAGG